MDFGTEIDGTQDFFQMFWPIIVSHKIDEESPLWEMSARDLTSKMQFEVFLTMELLQKQEIPYRLKFEFPLMKKTFSLTKGAHFISS